MELEQVKAESDRIHRAMVNLLERTNHCYRGKRCAVHAIDIDRYGAELVIIDWGNGSQYTVWTLDHALQVINGESIDETVHMLREPLANAQTFIMERRKLREQREGQFQRHQQQQIERITG